ncbi:hypothetical protein ABIF42_000360 [Bradyrhizobium diazoefficiens]
MASASSTWSEAAASVARRAMVTRPSASAAVGDHGGVAHQRDGVAGDVDGGSAGADVAAVLAFCGGGGEQPLVAGDPAHHGFHPGNAVAVPDDAGDLGLVHRVDHRGRGAGAPERVADVGDVVDRGAEAAELDRDHDAEQFLLTRDVESLVREAGVAIDPVCVGRCRYRGSGDALDQGGTLLEEVRLRFVDSENCFTHVHARPPPVCRSRSPTSFAMPRKRSSGHLCL